MKIINDLDKLNGKTIAFNAESWEDDIIAFGTTDGELIFIKSYFDHGSMEPRLKVLDFYYAKEALKEEKNLRHSIEKENPSILGDVSDEIKAAEEREKEEADYKKYIELDKKFRKRLISEGPFF